MRRFALVASLTWCAGVLPAQAIFVKTQMDRIDHEPLFDEHYFVSLLSFAYPAEWDNLWRQSASTVAYRINAASLDCCDLFLQQELQFQKILTEGFAFKFHMLQQEDKERQETHHWLELEKSLAAGFSASLFGEPTFHKEDADIGFGLGYGLGPFKASARHTFVDFNFNKRGSTNQRYTRYPETDEFSAEWAEGEKRLMAWLEFDSPLRRTIPDENRLFSYRRTTLVVGLRRDPPGSFSRRIEYSYEFQRKENFFNPDPGATSIESLRQVHHVLAAVEGPLSSIDRLEVGHALLVRAARTDFANAPNAGIFYRRWEAQPYARWRRRVKPWLWTDLGTFLSFGENRRRYPGGITPSVFETLAEAKLGAGLDFIFSPSGRIGVYSTFEMDRPAHLWGGGNVRAMFLF